MVIWGQPKSGNFGKVKNIRRHTILGVRLDMEVFCKKTIDFDV
jgi:hypothetical protein